MKIGARLIKIGKKHYIVFEKGKFPETPPLSESKVKLLINRKGLSEKELFKEAEEELRDYAIRRYNIGRIFIL